MSAVLSPPALLRSAALDFRVPTRKEQVGKVLTLPFSPEEETMFARVRSLLADVEGPTTVEYAVMLALIVLVAIGAITALGVKVTDVFALTVSLLPV